MTTPRMSCPSCTAKLIARQSRHGLVWFCRNCRSGAATLPVLRQVAPRDFVNHLWQAALHDGRVSPTRCPACQQPFTTFHGSQAYVEPQLEVCTRCHWVWLSPMSLSLLSQLREPPIAVQRREERRTVSSLRGRRLSPAQARESLSWLAGEVILLALP